MYFLGFGPCFVILSISVEGLFFVSYSMTLMAWAQVEKLLRPPIDNIQAKSEESAGTQNLKLLQSVAYNVRMDDLRIALFFLFFVQVAFFGTGKCVNQCFRRH